MTMMMRLLTLLLLLVVATITLPAQPIDETCVYNESKECQDAILTRNDETINEASSCNNHEEADAADSKEKKDESVTESDKGESTDEPNTEKEETLEPQESYVKRERLLYETLTRRHSLTHTIQYTYHYSVVLDIGVPQTFPLHDPEVDYQDMLEDYMGGAAHLAAVAKNPELQHILPQCKNKDPLCTYWATQGDCDYSGESKFWMTLNCCPVCEAAWLLDWLVECPFTRHQAHAWPEPGDLNTFFVNLTTLPQYQQYSPTIHSQPNSTNDSDAPWVVTLENVVSPEEAWALIQHGEQYGWQDSGISSDVQDDGSSESIISDYRTSTLAWCNSESCLQDPLVQRVLDRMANITQLHPNHSDYLQLLKYAPGDYYKEHHDIHHYQFYNSAGARIFTFYIYLSDVEQGGETNFPYLANLTISPKLGRALLWPNVLNDDPDTWDDRMFHQAMPVIKGEKYGATACEFCQGMLSCCCENPLTPSACFYLH